MESGNKKFALIVGCNYGGTEMELSGCINDAKAMKEMIIWRFGFKPDNIKIMTDEPGSSVLPTGANIRKALLDMIDMADPGDVLLFSYSGHGMQDEKKHESIVPCDTNLIYDVDFQALLERVPDGASFTMFTDSCYSGGLLVKERPQVGPPNESMLLSVSPRSKPRLVPREKVMRQLAAWTGINSPDIGTHLLKLFGEESSLLFRFPKKELDSLQRFGTDEGILLSGCRANELSMEDPYEPRGVFTSAVLKALKENPISLTNFEIMILANAVLISEGYKSQHPCLYCNDHNADAAMLGGIPKASSIASTK